jgi:uncharacterized protein (TIGR00106 family)
VSIIIISQLSISPVGEGIHLHTFVKEIIKVIKKHEINYEINDMATILETDNIDKLFSIIKESHDSLFKTGVKRVITELKIDDRRDINVLIGNKKSKVQ